MGYLYQNACTVACVCFTAAGTTVGHAFQHDQAVADGLVGFTSLDVCDEAYPA